MLRTYDQKSRVSSMDTHRVPDRVFTAYASRSERGSRYPIRIMAMAIIIPGQDRAIDTFLHQSSTILMP